MGAAALPILIGTTVASTVGQIDQARRVRKAGAAQTAAEQRRADIENTYKIRQSIRQARLAQGAMTNVAAQTGGIGGSGLAGGMSSVSSQLGGNLAFMDAVARENNVILNSQTTSARASSNAAVWGAVGQLGQTIFSPYVKAPRT